jgi:hypothetical protein
LVVSSGKGLRVRPCKGHATFTLRTCDKPWR